MSTLPDHWKTISRKPVVLGGSRRRRWLLTHDEDRTKLLYTVEVAIENSVHEYPCSVRRVNEHLNVVGRYPPDDTLIRSNDEYHLIH